jgi:hypothetical protein
MHIHTKDVADKTIQSAQDEEVTFTCLKQSCFNKTLTSISKLKIHLQEHAEDHENVVCPFINCSKEYNKKASLKCHFHRKHKNCTIFDVNSRYTGANISTNQLDIAEPNVDERDCSVAAEWDYDSESDCAETATLPDSIVGAVGDFYNSLMHDKRVPYKTTDYIAQKIAALHDQNMRLIEQSVRKVLLTDNPDVTREIISEMRKADILGIVHSNSSDVNMATQHGRLKYIDNNMPFVPALRIVINPSDPVQKQKELYYVPIADTLKMILTDLSYKRCATSAEISQGHQIGDIWDTEVYQENEFFQTNPTAIPLIIYSDEVTITNPLSSGTAKKHKMIAMYYTLGTIPAWNRTKVDTLQLIMTIRSEDYKLFPQSQCYKKVLTDLKLLENEGIYIDGEKVLAGVLYYSADNLEAHSLGGFSTNFSHDSICRTCDIKHEHLAEGRIHDFSDPALYPPFKKLSEEEYENLSQQENGRRVKFNCIFNELQSFHASKQFAPCLGHDLLEGVVSYDVYGLLKIMVQKRGWFSIDKLNHCISKFKFPSKDRPNAIVLANKHKLSGSAAQMWNLIRYLPYILHDLVPNLADPVFDLLVRLHDIVELITAPILTTSEIDLMEVRITDYLDLRQDFVTDDIVCSAKPKHHFVSHYPFLYNRFGPLILCWTLRFESKHRFFKDTAHKSKNFKNFLKMSSTRHQRLQAHLLHTGLFKPDFMLPENAVELNQAIAVNKVQSSLTRTIFLLAQSVPGSVYISKSVSYRGTKYTIDQLVILSNDTDNLQLHLGKVLKVVISSSEQTIHFVIRPYIAQNSGKGFYSVSKSGPINIISLSRLADYAPLSLINDTNVVILHHYPSNKNS